ncbi:MAG: L,D-transpeptidase family protein [Chloroflexota bacterium]
MTTPLQEARIAIQQAREALNSGDRMLARQWAERAAKLAPQLEDPWLVLAAVAGPRLGLAYIQRALQINPNSARARRGMEWVMQRLREPGEDTAGTQQTAAIGPGESRQTARSEYTAHAAPVRPRRRSALLPIILLVMGCMILGMAGWKAMSSPVVASLIAQPVLASEPTGSPQWAQASIAKPTYTSSAPIAAVLPAATPTAELIQMPDPPGPEELDLSTDISTALPTEFPTAAEPEIPTAEPTWSGSLSMDYVEDTPTPEAPPYIPPTAVQPSPGGTASGTHWIDVNLTQQMVYAYAGDTVVNSFVVSTGTWLTPTVTGKFKVWIKLRSSDMSGPDYYLPDVPYIMYFYKDYGLHGTYWHNNFGTPMSRGCVNLSIPDAEWLYNFSSVGTVVNVHY